MLFQWDLEQYLWWIELPTVLFLIGLCYLALAWCASSFVFIAAKFILDSVKR